MRTRTRMLVAVAAAALAAGGCAPGPGPGPGPETSPEPTYPGPSEVQAMDCAQIEDEVLEQLLALPHVTAASAPVENSSCVDPIQGPDMLTPPRFTVTVEGDIVAGDLAATRDGMSAIWAAYITPKVRTPEILRIDVEGVMEVEWVDGPSFDSALAQELLDVAAPGRYLAARLQEPAPARTADEPAPLTTDEPFFYLFVDGSALADDDAATAALDAAWADSQELATALGATATLGLVDVIDVAAADDGINPGPGRAQFLVDVPADGEMPAEFGPIALRTLDLADQSDLVRSDVYLRNFQPYARLIPTQGSGTISAESQAILDDITEQLEAAGYTFHFVHFF